MTSGNRELLLKHLNEDYTEPVRDPIWKHIYLSKPLIRIIELPVFQKLNNIKQLGPAFLIYPGAVHTRFNHSLGVFHIAKKIITQFILKSSDINFSIEDIKAFLCSALLHDIGHYPYAHSLKELEVTEHEELTADIILNNAKLKNIIEKELKIPSEYTASIIDINREYGKSPNINLFRKILSGVLDPDKLDYLNRDAYFCGVPYGIQDIDFILNEIYPDKRTGISISSKGLASVENILFSKYLMYRNVYWHKKVRIITAMIKKAIYMGLLEKIIKPGDLYDLDDFEFLSGIKNIPFSPFKIIEHGSLKQLYKSVYSIPFNPENTMHQKLENLNYRYETELKIAEKLKRNTGMEVSPEQVIIDIPEKITFEIDLSIKHGKSKITYTDSGSVFNEDTVKGFCRTLRQISLLIDNRISVQMNKIDLSEFLK
jgi:HD superfamily phosphohydrolase